MTSGNYVATSKVAKRDGRIERFLPGKMYESVRRAALSAGIREDEAMDLFREARAEIERRLLSGETVSTSMIADAIERLMIERSIQNPKWMEAAKRFELAKLYNDVYGKGGWKEFKEEDLRISFNALKVLEARYLLKKPETWRFKETPSLLFRRVARFLASVEKAYGKNDEDVMRIEEEFYRLLSELRFMPNSPTLMNAGTRLGILSACFVIPVRDAMTTADGEGIMDAVRAQAIIHQHGGGTGFSFSELRPEGDIVSSSGGMASGPLSFMRLFDVATDVVKQGGKRRGANMGILHVWHPDIMKFIKAKSGQLKDVHLQNFNISVGVYDWFMEAVERNESVPLVNPRKTDVSGEKDSRFYAISMARHRITDDWVAEAIIRELEDNGGSVPLDRTVIVTYDEALAIAEHNGGIVGRINARMMYEEMVRGAWDSGDPGLIFIDEINRRHPVWYLGKINATNPCGEQPLLPWESCNLGSINLEKYVKMANYGPTVDWDALARDVKVAVRFLDNVIDANRHPLDQITQANLRTRKIGLGVMGWARMLIRLGIPYDSADAVYLAWSLAEWIAWNAYMAGVELAKEKGTFPTWNPAMYRWIDEVRPFESVYSLISEAEKVTGKRLASGPSERLARILSERPEIDWEMLRKEALTYGLRNATYLSIAPTGSISIIAGTSSSIEPLFAISYVRRVAVGTFLEVDKLFIEELRKLEMDEPEVLEEIAETGSVQNLKWIPRSLRRLFKTAHDIDPEWHVLHQAAWQTWVDAAVSKTINLRHDEPPETVWTVYRLAWRLRLKGITVYRDRSKSQQVIYFGIRKEGESQKKEEKALPQETIEPREIKPTLVIEKRRKHVEEVEHQESQTRMTMGRTKLRMGSGKIKELVTVNEDYAGGCPTCDI